ncbi:hypothetical protein LP316_13310 [Thalassotalea sp. LPB0316]|uniref:hypothetical protein n=1 Tax=Thalassotalea sp. LPB0316 TaxID=2769490 RepID=UPI0018695132|nr:hypothetical protein [Thalassotalea sp. LPB0316]QOL25262.1 hypothetical protein LP316_13310 [Thalassotalea sp. LPB0316]
MLSALWFSPEHYHDIAQKYYPKRWHLLWWSFLSFVLFAALEYQIANQTPTPLISLALFILFFALQALVLGAFLFFFKTLPSKQFSAQQQSLAYRFYRTIEWAETLLFSFLLPLPALGFVYATLMILTRATS